ncbi:MAG: radical SAM-associated putative lipoprotein [Paramuribaculum sp.]|nr:radical SAM-associated putative lipoprotein [Paramuribaculum sp.]
MEKTQTGRWLTAILSSLITMLGFSGCNNQEYMYGTPYVEFELKGKVIDEKGDPVKGALITVRGKFKDNLEEFRWITPHYDSPEWQKYALYSNEKGEYEIENGLAYKVVRVVCIPPETSGLATDSVELKITYKRDRKEEWYIGSYSGTANFTLKEKKD